MKKLDDLSRYRRALGDAIEALQRKMPGKAARRALRALERKYGDLKIL